MTDPLSLLPLAIAAGGGTVDGVPASQWVAAGFTLLQRSATLVRGLAGRRSAILLPTSGSCLTALAASEGRSALLLDPAASDRELQSQLALAGVGAVFTLTSLLRRLPDALTALLDDAPGRAGVRMSGRMQDVDLGSHFPLQLHGDRDAEGSAEEVLSSFPRPVAQAPDTFTHRDLLERARALGRTAALGSDDRVLAAAPFSGVEGLLAGAIAPLLSGASVHTLPVFDREAALAALASQGVTTFVATAEQFASLLPDARHLAHFSRLRRCWIPASCSVGTALADRWRAATGVPLTVV